MKKDLELFVVDHAPNCRELYLDFQRGIVFDHVSESYPLYVYEWAGEPIAWYNDQSGWGYRVAVPEMW